MASGFRVTAKHSSAKSLGSFVEVGSACSSSDFEPVELEEGELSQGESDTSTSRLQRSTSGSMLGKNATPPPSSAASLRTVPEQSEIKPSPEATGPATEYPEPLQDGFQNLENATQKAAELAKEFTTKLLGGGAEARNSVYRLAGDVSSWWAALDPVPKQDSPQHSARSAKDSTDVQDMFGLPETEELMEKFPCTLIQTLECSHNPFSKPQQARFAGKLYITDKNTCFSAEGVRFAVPHANVKKTTKQTHETAAVLRIDFGEGQYVVLDGFKGSDLDSALGLLEHVTEA